jgi:uncharacterized repeat protein (TIGR03803 family)
VRWYYREDAESERGLITEAMRRTIKKRLLAAILGILATTSQGAPAQTLTTIYRFAGPDGASPCAGLVIDKQGNVYGTTLYGGSANYGTVFELTPAGVETVLHNFTLEPDGGYPQGSLVLDAEDNLYGTTGDGGASACSFTTGCGTVFRLTPSGEETVLHTFPGDPDGSYVAAGVIRDSHGDLYGTTYFGGMRCSGVGCGTVFKLVRSGKEIILHRFEFPNPSEPPKLRRQDGAHPLAGLVSDADGNLYGSTELGGPHNQGTIFKLSRSGKETILHSFTGRADGAAPYGNLIFDAQGNLYGTTYSGGTDGYGTVFKLDPKGTVTVLYGFTAKADGAHPAAGLVFDADGNLYGTTSFGGDLWGTIFRLSPVGVLTVLYTFTGQADGASPLAPLIIDADGNLYGTTTEGGNFEGGCVRPYGCGTVFKLTP